MDLPTIGKWVGGAAAIVTTLYGGGSWVDTRYNHQNEFLYKVAELQQELNETNDRVEYRALNEIRRQKDWTIHHLEDRNGMNREHWPQADKERAREAEAEKERIDRQLRIYEERILQQRAAPQVGR